jgi:ATP-dependent helicase Lhr and Lhr-like helicase
MTNPFYRLAPFIQDFIYREKWGELRQIQVDAITAIMDTSDHVLITSGTASGKTEAAFLPILTDLFKHPSASIGAIYIGPLKALINDQFHRLEILLEDSGIPVQSWHGDVSQSKKQRFLRVGQGILQITPESLEAMLINRQTELRRLFGDLRYVVLDEVHALINSDRGRQVLCQLQRLVRYQAQPARRIGLSATLGEPELAMNWLAGGTDFQVAHIHDNLGRREVMLGLEHFIAANNEDNDDLDDQFGFKPDSEEKRSGQSIDGPSNMNDALIDEAEDMFRHMADMVNTSRKTLIFANSRNDTEEVIHNLRRISGAEAEDEDGYYVHHGSISAVLRERAEQDMRDADKSACVAATVTMELGIDIGNLDQVLQVNATNTVSSFVQRLGRSGRRGGAAKMFFYSRETERQSDAPLGERIPWGLLQTIAIIQLYLEEKWIEPPVIPTLPMSLLYHQTMSTITAHTELTPSEIAEQILTLSPFKEVTFDQYRELLRHLLDLEHLERIDDGGLIIGLRQQL